MFDKKIFDWVHIPKGSFLMGTDISVDKVAKNLDWAKKVEVPQHKVYLNDFYISRYPVTNAIWDIFLKQTDYKWADKDKLWDSGLPAGKEQHPVTWVTWFDALAFCEWAGVRLPTEAEWEKTARGIDGRLYPWGNEEPTSKLANYNKHEGDTTEVNHYVDGKSPYDVYDLSGNTWEWTSSIWGTDADNPEFLYPYKADDGRENLDDNQILRVVRAGGWKYSADLIRASQRDWNKPNVRGSALGFRVAIDFDKLDI